MCVTVLHFSNPAQCRLQSAQGARMRYTRSYLLNNAHAHADVYDSMDDEENTTIGDFNRTLFRGCPAGSLQLAGELTERSLGYPLNVMSLLYYECGDTLNTGDESAPHH